MIAATIALCALGHAIRDGFMPTGSTHAARALGGFCCVLGGFLLTWSWEGALLGFSIYGGFYADSMHGEGQRARGWMDVPYLAVSGVTSLLPTALFVGTKAISLDGTVLTIVFDLAALAILLAGLAKPAIWFSAWLLPESWQPTRIAAVVWGALTGGLIGWLG